LLACFSSRAANDGVILGETDWHETAFDTVAIAGHNGNGTAAIAD
jgi:hypothetical protein